MKGSKLNLGTTFTEEMRGEARPKTLAELVDAHDQAVQDLEDAVRKEQAARSMRCTATNAVNDLQKQIDAKLAELKKTAPRDTNWADQSRARMDVGDRP